MCLGDMLIHLKGTATTFAHRSTISGVMEKAAELTSSLSVLVSKKISLSNCLTSLAMIT